MKKILSWLDSYILKISVLFLIAFIPLYPKFPLFDIKYTWVYIRLDDLAVGLATFIFGVQLLRRKITLRTPLTAPIVIYWITGFLTTLFSLIFIVGHIPHVFSSLVVLHYLRRIEYIVVFFIAFNSIRSRKDLFHYILVLSLTILAIVVYSLGQRFAGFPAILTMNEEFAKGKFLYLPPTARITATFAGHYDLAAYLVFVIPAITSFAFAVGRLRLRILLFFLAFSAYIILLFTESRVSIAAYLVSISFALFLLKKRWLIIPVLVVSLLLMNFFSGSSERFYKTFRIRKVAFNLETGRPVAAIEKIDKKSGIAILESQEITKEELPVGTGFIGIPIESNNIVETDKSGLIRKGKKGKKYITEIRKLQYKTYATQELASTSQAKLATVSGKFIIGKALVYDMSFTTRFQGQWPRALAAFKRNPILGSGFSAISLATDNDYLRMLGESGILGTVGFALIFFCFGVFIYRTQRSIDSLPEKYFILGVAAGIVGLALNAVFIDVFEASKVAYTLWLIVGVSAGAVYFLKPFKINLFDELVAFFTTVPVILASIVLISFAFIFNLINNYFVGDDFTWLRWAAESSFADLILFFIKADGFFYRPLQKLLYLIMFNVFWLIPGGYHFISLSVHIAIGICIFLIVNKLAKDKLPALIASLIFLFLASNSESLFWISSLGNQLSVLFIVWSIYFYIIARERSYLLLFVVFVFNILAILAYEGGIVAPLIILLWELLSKKRKLIRTLPFLLLIPAYIALRNFAGAHGLSGDYNYNLLKLPANVVGNVPGYIGMLLTGPRLVQPWFSTLRFIAKSNLGLFIIFSVLFVSGIFIFALVAVKKKLLSRQSKFFIGFLLIALLPFLGLGNISVRYSYFAAPAFSILVGFGIVYFYNKFKKVNLALSLIFLTITTVSILSYNIFRLVQTSRDWRKAGSIVQDTIIALKLEYFPLLGEANFFFVNVPIRHGLAWVFPVGLDDAIWHSFRNPWINTHIVGSVGEAFKKAEGMKNSHIFFFDKNKLQEVSTETIEFEKEFTIELEVEE